MNVKTPPALARRAPTVIIRSEFATSNEVSAGGPSILDVTPVTTRAGADVTVTLRGLNFSESSRVRVAGETLAPVFTEGALQSLTVAIPARLVAQAGEVRIVVEEAGAESNPVRLTVVP